MQTDLLKVIKDKIPSMSKGHKLIASYILDHCDKAAYLTATKLGERTGVSESTVVRFAIELGYKGYPEFQSELQMNIRSKLTAVQRIEVADNRIREGDILGSVLAADIRNIKTSLESINLDSFNLAVDMISQASSIYVIGVRSSSVLSYFVHYYLNLIFENVHMIQTSSASEMFENMLRISQKDVLIGISFPRYSKRTKNAVEFAKTRGAKIVVITDGERSPIAQYADSKLYAKSDMASFVDSLVAPLSIINALIVAVGRKNREMLAHTFCELEEIWEEYDVYEKSQYTDDSHAQGEAVDDRTRVEQRRNVKERD